MDWLEPGFDGWDMMQQYAGMYFAGLNRSMWHVGGSEIGSMLGFTCLNSRRQRGCANKSSVTVVREAGLSDRCIGNWTMSGQLCPGPRWTTRGGGNWPTTRWDTPTGLCGSFRIGLRALGGRSTTEENRPWAI